MAPVLLNVICGSQNCDPIDQLHILVKNSEKHVIVHRTDLKQIQPEKEPTHF